MLERLKAAILDALGSQQEPPEPEPFVPIVKNGHARICDPEQIPETYCDVSTKDEGERYLGLRSGVVYDKVEPWELDGRRD